MFDVSLIIYILLFGLSLSDDTTVDPVVPVAANATTDNSTKSTNNTKYDYGNCYYFCPTWISLLILSLMVLLLCCLCAALNQQQPREIWYMVERPTGAGITGPVRAQPMRKP